MEIPQLIPRELVRCESDISSKKRALQELAGLLASSQAGLKEDDVFDSLLERERLGSTGLGHGVAIPHGRIASISGATAAVLRLNKAVDYDAPDDTPVDILIGLIVPEDSTTEHLEILSCLAEVLSKEDSRTKIRKALSADELTTIIHNWTCSDAA